MRAVLYPALLMLVACGAGESRSSVPTPGGEPARVYLSERWLGVAYCTNNTAHAWVRADIIHSPEGPQTLAHELDHLDLMRSFPSCEEFHAWSRSDRKNPMRMEARAFCVSARVDAESGRVASRDSAIRMHAARLAYGYPFGLTQAEAEVEIRRFCTQPPPVP